MTRGLSLASRFRTYPQRASRVLINRACVSPFGSLPGANGPGSKVPTPLKLLSKALYFGSANHLSSSCPEGGSGSGSGSDDELDSEGEGGDYDMSGYYNPRLVPPGGTYGPIMTFRWEWEANDDSDPTRKFVPVTDLWLQIAKGVVGVPEAIWEADLKESYGTVAPSSLAFTSHCIPSPSDDLKPAHLQLLKPCYRVSDLFHASLTLPKETSSIPVVVRIVEEESFASFAKEVLAYRQLRDLPVVPRLLAALRNPENTAGAFMVLENAGKPVHRGVWSEITPSLSESDKKAIYFALVQIHARGVVHGCVSPWSVVRRPNGAMCFVDLGDSELGHRCDPQTCEELCDLREDLGLPDDITNDRTVGRDY
ncbi:hypothetical protein GGX14DRAFT_694490 [Mycena pura]|uniref:Protein kinase domain-containing protein n=1 Tax=Mycena pura TaxID=153505 RepID=A0AAD6VVF0_9AGAR|nr:hypothetical protein GGX14DRAFT_694490 [Mycena pura]